MRSTWLHDVFAWLVDLIDAPAVVVALTLIYQLGLVYIGYQIFMYIKHVLVLNGVKLP